MTATADPDQAIADIVHSAFGHAGQKCSAASLAIVEASVYDDGVFLGRLADAARSLRPGSAWEPPTSMGPLIQPPQGPLGRALTRLEAGERWLVEPQRLDREGYLWSAAIKAGVEPGSAFHLTECFGPVLGVMRADDLEHAVSLQNQPPYGLTAGLSALDPSEIDYWRESVEAGNLYVNRGITGAIVQRQPFGGWKRSVVGPAAKAGGPNYVASLGSWPAVAAAQQVGSYAAACRSVWRDMQVPADPSGLVAESNVLRYRPLRRVALWAGRDLGERDVACARAAAAVAGTELTLVADAGELTAAAAKGVDKLRLLVADEDARRLAHGTGAWVDDLPVAAQPEREMLRWVREQAVSESRHRHGNVTARRPGLLGPPP